MMNRTLFIGVLAAALAVSPAFAAKSHRSKAARPAAKKTVIDWEREAWGDTSPAKTAKKKPNRKAAAAKKKPAVTATVTLRPNVKKPPVVAKTEPPKPEAVKPEEKPTVATADSTGKKTPEELEKEAKAAKNPDQKMASYNQLLQGNPNYAYAGDVYKDMYNLARQNGADTLTQLQYAGKAAQMLSQGRSHGPVNPNDVRNLNKATDNLINQWIEEQTRKILSDAGRK
jgi:outer membrane biosynthesis protein TonB